jgi:hypothetical protein
MSNIVSLMRKKEYPVTLALYIHEYTCFCVFLGKFRPLKVRPLRSLETSNTSYPMTRCHITEERRLHYPVCLGVGR